MTVSPNHARSERQRAIAVAASPPSPLTRALVAG
jgi:hypothetical protein